MRARAHILVVEDERHVAEGIRDNLLAEGYQVHVVDNGDDALACWQSWRADLIILDVMLPQRDGWAVCQAIRQAGGLLPILFLTAKNEPQDRICGLQMGGDDYLGKPFDLRELLSRVHAILRRQAWSEGASHASLNVFGDALGGPWEGALGDASCVFFLAGHTVDFRAHEVTDPCGRVEMLASKEIRMLKLLRQHAGDVVGFQEMLEYVWQDEVYPSKRVLENVIERLRQRFEPDAARPCYFHTVRGMGYRLTLDGDMPESPE